MKDKSFVIKVGDLLQEGGKVDKFDFEEKLSYELQNLNEKGISGTIVLRSLNQDSLYVTAENILCYLEESCDRCLAKYLRKVETNEYKARFVISEKIKQEEEDTSEEEIFVINARDETIDLEPIIVQAIKLQDPFIKHCPICEKEIEKIADEEDSDDNLEHGNNIFFS